LKSSYDIYPIGDNALTISFGNVISEELNKKVTSLFNHLKASPINGVKNLVPAYSSLTIVYDVAHLKSIINSVTVFEWMKTEVEKLLHLVHLHDCNTRLISIPVCYDLALATDIKYVAEQNNLSIKDVIDLHIEMEYRVYMIGFLPGFPYMASVIDKIATPRKKQPQKHVAKGSVGIAGFQTGIYPFDSPGGWQIIGRTPVQMFDKAKDDPCFLRPGDQVRFYSISLDQFERVSIQ
jgi:inhibitor of KinA